MIYFFENRCIYRYLGIFQGKAMNIFYYYIVIIEILFLKFANSQYSYPAFTHNIEDDLAEGKKGDYGRLTGDIQNWAAIIQNYIIQVSIIITRFLFNFWKCCYN